MQTKLYFCCLIIFSVSIKLIYAQNYDKPYETEKYETISKCDDRQLPRKKIVCFYRVEDEFRPYDVDPCLCTHLIYSYVAVRENLAFIAGKKGDLKFLSALKQQNAGLKILVSLRPSNNQFLLEETERSNPNSNSLAVKTKFAKRVREFIRRHGLDGVDLDWEYFKEAHNHITKRETLLSLLNILNNELKPFNETSEDIHSLLTITTSKYGRDLTDYYDFSEIYRYVDFVNVPAFNFDANPKTVTHPSRLHGMADMENMDSIIDLILALGLPQEQLVVGVPAHGTLFRLLNVSLTEPGSPATAWNNEEVIISHSKICTVRDSTNWTLVRDKDLTAPYIYSKEKWIGFDDEISIKLKAKYIALRQLSGLAIWSLNDDDYSGKCGYGPFPLLRTIRNVFLKPTENINYNKSIDTYRQFNDLSDNSFVAVIEKYGNVERITDSGSDDNQLSCTQSGYIRHPNDCSKFYRCVHFEGKEGNPEIFQYNCPIGMVFDDRYELCNWPSWSPPCLGSGEIEVTPKKRFVCQSFGYFQDPENCEYFYYCSDFGKTYLQSYQMKCPFDLAFDEQKLLCNWKWLVNGCGPIDPEDQVIRDLPQLLNQNTGNDESAQESGDIIQERSDYIDVDTTYSQLNSDSNQNSSPDTNRKGGSRFRKITQYMTKLVADMGSRLKSMFYSKIDSRSDRPGNRWLSRMNDYVPKLNRKRPIQGSNQRISGKQRNSYHNDPLISIPILELRPDSHDLRNGPIKGKPYPQRKVPLSSVSVSKPNKHPINQFSLSALQDPNDRFQLSSITKTVQKLQEIIPLKGTKNRNQNHGKDGPREPMAMSSNIREIKVPASHSSSAKPSRRPQKNLKNRFRSKFHFPTPEPLMIETLEELELPHYLPQQLSLQSIPGPKKSNVRNQQQRYLGGVSPQKEILHFTPEELNLEKIKTKGLQKDQTRDKPKQFKQNYVKNNNKNIDSIEINFKNIDSKLLDSLQYSLTENNYKNDFQTIHLANNPNKEIKVNVNKDLKPSMNVRQNTGEGLPHNRHNSQKYRDRPNVPEVLQLTSDTKIHQILKLPNNLMDPKIPNQRLPTRRPIENQRIVESLQNERPQNGLQMNVKPKNSNQKPINTIHFGPSVQHLNQYLPNTEEILQKNVFNKPLSQKKPETGSQSPPKQHRHPENNRKPMNTKQHSFVWPEVEQNPPPIVNLGNIEDFESKKVMENKQKDSKPLTQRQNNQNLLHMSSGFPNRNQNIKQNIEEKRTRNPLNTGSHGFEKNSEQLDTSASINEYASHQSNQRPIYGKTNANKVGSTQDIRNKNRLKSSDGLNDGHKENEKSQLLIVPISDDYTNSQKLTNFEKITKEYPKLFPEDMIMDNKNILHSEVKTTPRPRVIFTAPSSASTLGPSLSDEYIMLMLNNEHNLLNNSDRQNSIHEIFKKTDGKLYNLETDSSKTLVALVPKTPTTPKPVLYEAIPNLVSFNVTQPPVVIKFEIPRPKSDVFQSIVQKVRDEWLSGPPFSQSVYSTLAPYHVIRNDFQNPYNQKTESSTAQPSVSTSQIPFDTQNLPSIYDSLQQIIAQNQWSQFKASTSSSVQTSETTTSSPITTTTQSSVILEHIPIYGGYETPNRTNGMSWPQSGIPWYQQVVSYPAPVNPYPPMQTYPQMAANYPYYPMQSGYGYRTPPNMSPNYSFQPQFLSPNMTSNNWYDFYGNDQKNSQTSETTTTTTTTSTSTTSTTTPSTTTERIIISSSATQRPVPRVRNRPSFARRTSTTKKPKTTTTEELKVEVSTQESLDIQRAHNKNNNRDKQKIQVILVDQNNQEQVVRRPDISDQTDVKVVYMDGSKQDIKETHYTNNNPKEETRERYGLRNGIKPTNDENPRNDRNQYNLDSDPNQKSSPHLTDTDTTPDLVELPINKDIEYEDEPEVSSLANEEMKSSPLAPNRVESEPIVHNISSFGNIRNISESSLPESACTRPGLFQHPFDCNKFYECFWDKYINKFTIHSFECPVKLAFDSRIIGCGLPNDPTICVQY